MILWFLELLPPRARGNYGDMRFNYQLEGFRALKHSLFLYKIYSLSKRVTKHHGRRLATCIYLRPFKHNMYI
jgi:hypothetical protein